MSDIHPLDRQMWEGLTQNDAASVRRALEAGANPNGLTPATSSDAMGRLTSSATMLFQLPASTARFGEIYGARTGGSDGFNWIRETLVCPGIGDALAELVRAGAELHGAIGVELLAGRAVLDDSIELARALCERGHESILRDTTEGRTSLASTYYLDDRTEVRAWLAAMQARRAAESALAGGAPVP